MKIKAPSVVALTWKLTDTLDEELDVLSDPVDFFVGGTGLLPVIESALTDKGVGDELQLQVEPENAFGEYDAGLVFLEDRQYFVDGIEAGMLIEGGSLPKECSAAAKSCPMLTISEVYPEHVVLDGNHPLSGMALRLYIKVEGVRDASPEELAKKSCGAGFFVAWR